MNVDEAYAELGLTPDASLAEAKAAWRSLVSRWHPDRNGQDDASRRMQRINRALAQIRDGGPGRATRTPATDPAPAPPRTVQRRVSVTLAEAAAGCIKPLRGTVLDPCAACAGSGRALQPQNCATCSGQGRVRERAWFGWYGPALDCTACEGSGLQHPVCPCCNGQGRTEVARYRLSVRLPPGVRDGDLLHVAPGGRAAVALDIHIQLQRHAHLALDDDGTLRCEWPVDGFGWIANRTVDVPTLQGLQPLGLQRGQVIYRLPGQGFPMSRSGPPADQIVIVVPHFPARLSRTQQRLLDQLADSSAAAQVRG